VVLTPNTFLQVQNPAVFIVNLHVHRSYPCASVFAGWEVSEENTASLLAFKGFAKSIICVNRLLN